MAEAEAQTLKRLGSEALESELPGEKKQKLDRGQHGQRGKESALNLQSTNLPSASAPARTRLQPANETLPAPISKMGLEPTIPIMPPSLELTTGVKADLRASKGHVGQEEVGIIGYVGGDLAAVSGVIKQRFTDFLVNEVGMDGQVIHLKDIGKPKEPKAEVNGDGKATKGSSESKTASAEVARSGPAEEEKPEEEPLPESLRFEVRPGWSENATLILRPHFSHETIISLHNLFVEGKEPPRKSDNGWGSRPVRPAEPAMTEEEQAMNAMNGESAEAGPSAVAGPTADQSGSGRRGQGRDRGRGRGGRGGRGGGGNAYGGREPVKDDREVVSQLVPDKDARAACHQAVREAFKGVFESAAKQVEGEEGSRIVVTYARGGSRQSGWGNNQQKPNNKRLPPFIHFNLQKTNRETQDALSILSRQIGCQVKDLGIAGTKDKRAVTVQRVSLKRGNKTMEGVWKAINGLKGAGAKGSNERRVMKERGDRGVRVGDFGYEREGLDLGLLKGNQFKITLRNVQGGSDEAIDITLASLRDHGFINFYGMQRFGTSSVPTHLTGLHILRGNWGEAVDSILSLRQNEHPDCVRGRLAWLEDKDVNEALKLMPRRCVAERCVWEFYKRSGGVTDKLGALSSIPRNLRTMYVHAYQSYIWNLVTSERIKLSSTKPLAGDLVIIKQRSSSTDAVLDVDGGDETQASARSARPALETSSSQDVKHLTPEDLDRYTIFDVVVPLPGFDVEYPRGRIGELYEEMMKADGLDVHHMRRDQREYSLPGSYRPIINRPTSLTWRQIRYTDPNLPLVQSDEDALLNLDAPVEPGVDEPEGKFRAVILELTLGPAAYATMALREVTHEETASWWQTSLTVMGEDQGYRDGGKGGGGEVKGEAGEAGAEEKADEGDEEEAAENGE